MARKAFVSILQFLLFSLPFCFADWSNQSRLVTKPCNVVNNSNVLINLAEDPTQTIQNNYQSYGVTFNNSDTRHLSLFRIEENLTNHNNDNPSANSPGILVTIQCDYTDADGWYFVNDNNHTSKRPFTLNVSKITRPSSGGGLGTSATYDEMDENSPTLIVFGNKGNGVVNFYLSYTGYSQPNVLGGIVKYSVFADYLYDYDVGICLPSTDAYLEPGYYTTKLTVTIQPYKIHSASASFNFFGLGSINVNQDGDLITPVPMELVIRGYVGDDSLTITDVSSFLVNSGVDAYSMQLSPDGRKATPYDIANVLFFHSESNAQKTENGDDKYTLFISPTSDYRATYEPEEKPYYLVKIGSEYNRTPENTVQFILCNENGVELTKATSRFGEKTRTYQIKANYNNPKKNTTTNKYDEEWTIDKEVYLKIDDNPSTANYEPGVYYSDIYFTLMTL